jgi:hypothetical protein
MRWTQCVRMAALAAAAIAISGASFAQSHPEYIRLGQLSAALYKPDSGQAPHVAFPLVLNLTRSASFKDSPRT